MSLPRDSKKSHDPRTIDYYFSRTEFAAGCPGTVKTVIDPRGGVNIPHPSLPSPSFPDEALPDHPVSFQPLAQFSAARGLETSSCQSKSSLQPSLLPSCWSHSHTYPSISLDQSRSSLLLFEFTRTNNGLVPRPLSVDIQDRWDSRHVMMPCSPYNKYLNSAKVVVPRWDIICATWRHSVVSSYDIEEFILSYNLAHRKSWDFSTLHFYCNEWLGPELRDTFFHKLLPLMVQRCFQLPDAVPLPIPLLLCGQNQSISLTQYQVSVLLANAFLCTFPGRNSPPAAAVQLPSINFNRLYSDTSAERKFCKTNKLHSLLHYFSRILEEDHDAVITFARTTILPKSFSDWTNCKEMIGSLQVFEDQTIENFTCGYLQVDFANASVGGGVLADGCVQEEILFMCCPELLLARLFSERLGDTECLFVTGAERYNRSSGYASSFCWESSYIDTTCRDQYQRLCRQVVAMDSLCYRTHEEQFRQDLILRELNKAHCGFSGYEGCIPFSFVVTGNWGCGAFKGDRELKAIVQLMAAACCQKGLVYCSFGDKNFAERLAKTHEFLVEKGLTVGDLWSALSCLCLMQPPRPGVFSHCVQYLA